MSQATPAINPHPGNAGSGGYTEPEWSVALLFPPRGEWTEAEFFALPGERRVELSAGCVEVLELPTESHQIVLAALFQAVSEFVVSRGLGLVLFAGLPVRLWDGKIREPDLAFLSTAHASRRHEQYWEGADLVMEVISPEGRDRDEVVKRGEYAQAGIEEYWLVDPEDRRVTVLSLSGGAYRVHGVFGAGAIATSLLLPGFELAVDAIFERLPAPTGD